MISAGQALLRPEQVAGVPWGVLEAIGVASLATAPLILAPAWTRAAAGLALLAGYQALLDGFWLDQVTHAVHNGPLGSLAWAGLMLLGTAVADVWRSAPPGRRTALLLGVGAAAAASAVGLSPWFPIAKTRASASYMLLSLGLSLGLIALAQAALGARPGALGWLQRVGRHPLPLYLAHLVLLAPLTLAPDPAWYAAAPPWLTLAQAMVAAAALIGLAALLERRGWALRL